jgi:outer membrane lipoprotein SlyB
MRTLHFLSVGILVLAAGCASSGPSNMPVYDRSQVGQVVSGQRGEVVSVRDVLIKGQAEQQGSAGRGARLGSAAVTGAIFGAPERAVASVLGGMAGSAAGAKLDDRMGEEIMVTLEGGKTVTIVQERVAGVPPIAPGERVIVQSGSGSSMSGGGNTRVIRDETGGSDVVGGPVESSPRRNY